VLLGQGIAPRGYNLLADATPLDDLEAKLGDLRERIALNAGDMSDHADFLASYCPAAPVSFNKVSAA
jgi:tryptophan halogenase